MYFTIYFAYSFVPTHLLKKLNAKTIMKYFVQSQATYYNNDDIMRDIFHGYTTGSREWTYDRKRFSEGEFRSTFGHLLPNDIIHDAAAAFLAATHLDVLLFSVPMNRSHPGLQRDVIFIQRFESQYWNMYSFVSFYDINDPLNRAFEDAYSGALTEYDIIDLVEPANEVHQRAIIETWFDINNWFDILQSYDLEGLGEIEDIINGQIPEPLNAGADVFIPELTPAQLELEADQQQQQQQQQVFAQWSVLDLI